MAHAGQREDRPLQGQQGGERPPTNSKESPQARKPSAIARKVFAAIHHQAPRRRPLTHADAHAGRRGHDEGEGDGGEQARGVRWIMPKF